MHGERISALCASCDGLFTFSQGKLAATVCLGLPIQAQASADPDLCLFTQQNTFTASIKSNIAYTHTHMQEFKEHQMKWNINLHWVSWELLLPSSIQPVPASLSLLNDIRAQSFKRSIPLMSGNLIFKLPSKTAAANPFPIFQPASTSFYPYYILLKWCNPASLPPSPSHSQVIHSFRANWSPYHKCLDSWPLLELLLDIWHTNKCCTAGSRLHQSSDTLLEILELEKWDFHRCFLYVLYQSHCIGLFVWVLIRGQSWGEKTLSVPLRVLPWY